MTKTKFKHVSSTQSQGKERVHKPRPLVEHFCDECGKMSLYVYRLPGRSGDWNCCINCIDQYKIQ